MLLAVVEPRRKTWIDPSKATGDAITDKVKKYPGGFLSNLNQSGGFL